MFASLYDLPPTCVSPRTSKVLLDIASNSYPYIEREPYVQACYVQNLLTVVTYIPSLRPQILEMIVENLLKLDVSASVLTCMVKRAL